MRSVRDQVLERTEVLDALRGAYRVVVATHPAPDGDGLCASQALVLGLRAAGIEARVVVGAEVPRRLRSMQRYCEVELVSAPDTASFVQGADLAVTVDIGGLAGHTPVGGALAASKAQVIALDHHVPRRPTPGILIPDSSSSGEIVFHVLEALEVQLDAPMAHLLYLSVSYDTLSFRFLKDAAATLALASRLVAAGAEPFRAQRELFQQASRDSVTMMARALANVTEAAEGRILYTVIDESVTAGLAVEPEDFREVIQRLISTAGVDVAMTVVPVPKRGRIRLSFRAKGRVDVEPVARKFGGGGHAQACGATVNGNKVEKLVARALEALERRLEVRGDSEELK